MQISTIISNESNKSMGKVVSWVNMTLNNTIKALLVYYYCLTIRLTRTGDERDAVYRRPDCEDRVT